MLTAIKTIINETKLNISWLLNISWHVFLVQYPKKYCESSRFGPFEAEHNKKYQ